MGISKTTYPETGAENSQPWIISKQSQYQSSQVALMVKNPSANSGNVRDRCFIPGSGRSPGGEHGNPLHYSFLWNPMNRGVLKAIGSQSVGHEWSDLACTKKHSNPESFSEIEIIAVL